MSASATAASKSRALISPWTFAVTLTNSGSDRPGSNCCCRRKERSASKALIENKRANGTPVTAPGDQQGGDDPQVLRRDQPNLPDQRRSQLDLRPFLRRKQFHEGPGHPEAVASF